MEECYFNIKNNHYIVKKIACKMAKQYIKENHYTHGCHNGASPCYGLFDNDTLIGCLMFATPCSENVRSSVFGVEHKDKVTELHRLHIKDVTPKNTESWFIMQCIKLLKQDNPKIKGIISFSDSTEGHEGVIYKATNFYRIGSTGSAVFYKDETGRLRHPRQCGVNISKQMADDLGWTPCKRGSKNRYLFISASSKREKKELINLCRYDLSKSDGSLK